MNNNEKKMSELLKRLKNDYGVIGIKAEFEAEGTRLFEMISLSEIIHRADSELFLKIGGCEAVTDIDISKTFGAKGLISPMIESPFALKKFVSSFEKTYKGYDINDCELFFNIETKTAFENLDEILKTPEISKMKGAIIGRVDFSSSYNLSRDDIDSEFINEKCYYIFKKLKEKNLISGVGGAVSHKSIPALKKWEGLIDRAETRKIIFDLTKGTSRLENGLKLAIEFEYLYMLNLSNIYTNMSKENSERIEMLKKRLENF